MVIVVWASQCERWHLDLEKNNMGLVTCRLVDSQDNVTYRPVIQKQLSWENVPNIADDLYETVVAAIQKLYKQGILYSRVGRLPHTIDLAI
ncbi:hypothetical protein ACS2BX_26055 [Bacillus cereus group sp. BceL300]|uniref:hypothetical protein n=1 Tax=Bacillus cereus group sp. BceL300 TaxID=3444985 RepID=UPI003F24D413